MSSFVSSVQDTAVAAKDRALQAVDGQLPPGARQNAYAAVRRWVEENPRLAGFVAAHLVLSGPPLVLFFLLAVSTLISSILTCFVIAVVTAFSFTALCIGAALLVLIPTLVVSTVSASVLFAWAFVAYTVIQRLSSDPRTAPYAAAAKDTAYSTAQRIKEKTYRASQLVDEKANGIANGMARNLHAGGLGNGIESSSDTHKANSDEPPTAVRVQSTGVDGAGEHRNSSAGLAESSTPNGSPLINESDTLPRYRRYSKSGSASNQKRMGMLNETAPDLDGDVTPLNIDDDSVVDREFARSVRAAVPLNMGNPKSGSAVVAS